MNLRLLAAAFLLLTGTGSAQQEAAGFDPSAHREVLLAGVEALPATGTPGHVAVFGETAFALVTAKDKAVAAAALHGKGRVFAIAHGGYLNGRHLQEGDPIGQLLRNVLVWLRPNEKEGPLKALVLNPGNRGFLEALGHEVVVGPRDDWSSFDLVVADAGHASETEIAAMASYVAAGGSLLSAACPWGWAQVTGSSVPMLPDNRGLIPMGLCFADGYASNPPYAVDAAAARRAHAGLALQELLAGGQPRMDALEMTIASLPTGDEFFLAPMLEALPTIGDANAPREQQPLLRQQHGLERLAVLVQSRAWKSMPAGEIPAAPGSRVFPGPIPPSAERIERVLEIEAGAQGWQSTGLYLAPGEVLRSEVLAGDAASWRIQIGCHSDRLWHLKEWKRWPEITRSAALGEDIASPYGGLVYLIGKGDSQALKAQLTGAVESALYDRRFPMSKKKWKKERKKPAPWAELVGHHIVLTVPRASIQMLDDPEEAIAYWDELTASHFAFGAEPLPDRPERFVADVQISAGYMHSGYPIMTWLDVVEPQRGKLCKLLNVGGLRKWGNWGYFHELGHNRQKGDWTFGGTGEVTNNLFSLHGGEVMAGIEPWRNPWLEGQKEAGRKYLREGADFDDWKRKPGVALLCYAQIQRQFGWEPFTEVFAEYRTLAPAERPRNDAAKRDQWVRRMSLQVGRDLRPFHLHWGWPLGEDLLEDAELDGLKEWMPKPLLW